MLTFIQSMDKILNIGHANLFKSILRALAREFAKVINYLIPL